MKGNTSVIFIVLFFAAIGASRADNYLPISRYTDITDRLNRITVEGGCQKLQEIKQHVEDVMTDSGLRPDTSKPFCHDEDPYEFSCSILKSSKSAPMMGSEIPSICSSYMKIKACYENECGPSGKQFSNRDRFRQSAPSSSENSCPQKAKKECVQSIESVREVTRDTCIPVATALKCFREKLDYCSGYDQEQIGVDLAQNGLAQHVQHCYEKGIPVTGGEEPTIATGEGTKANVTTYTVMEGTSRDDYVPFSKYTVISSLLNTITVENACSQLQEIKNRMEDVISESGRRHDTSKPFCHDTEPYPYCSMLSNAKGTPMLGDEIPTICSIYVKIKACLEIECGPTGKKFDNPYSNMDSASHNEKSCPKEATAKCIKPVAEVMEVNDNSCKPMVEAKMCFADKLLSCSGFTEEQFASDIILVGIMQHIQRCKDDKKALSSPGELCVPDPLDTFVPSGFLEKMAKGPSSNAQKDIDAFLKENCQIVESIGTKLQDYGTRCEMKPHLANFVDKAIQNLLAPRLFCMKSGYNLPACNSGIKCPARSTMILIVAVVCLTTRFIQMLQE